MAVQTVPVNAKSRTQRGSRANKRLRDGGQVPAVIYGHKEAVISIALDRKEVADHLARGVHLFDIQLDGKSEKALVKEVQYDHLGIELVHVDFNRVSLDEKVEVSVRIELKGTPKGAADGGVLTQILKSLEVECRVLEIPEVIRHNVSEMEMDSVLMVKDLVLPPNVKAMQDGELIVATVREVLEAAPTTATEGPAEPEIIGKKLEEGEEAEAAEGATAGAKPATGAAPAAAPAKK